MNPWRRSKRDHEDGDDAHPQAFHPFAPVTEDLETRDDPATAFAELAQTASGDPQEALVPSHPYSQEAPFNPTEPAPFPEPLVHTDQDTTLVAELEVDDAPVTDVMDVTHAPDETDQTEQTDSEPDAQPRPKRSGRNMVAATTVGLSLMALVLGSAWFHPLALAVVLYTFCVGAIIEWQRALSRRGREISLVPILITVGGMGFATWFGLAEGLAVALLVGCAGVVAWRVVDERIENTLADSLASMLTLMWIPFLASFVLLMAQAENGWQRVFILLVAVVGNDAGGLYAGMAFGKRPFSPRISPKKTWEGAIGGVVLAASAATALAYFLMDERWWLGLIVGVVVAVGSIAGDLAESAIKRDMQVKDMSQAIPGHGGIMDRLDSMLVAAPVAYLVFAIFLGTR